VTGRKAPKRNNDGGREGAADSAREALLAEVATLYYVDHFTQREIARKIDRSVATVSRLLAKAHAAEVVEVSVRYPIPTVPAFQAALVNQFGLRAARVIRTPANDTHTLIPRIGDLAGRYISTILHDDTVVTVAWGATVRGVVYAIQAGQHRDLHVVQGLGSLGSRLPAIDNPLLIQVLADRLGATAHFLPAPMIVESAAVHDALCRDPHFRESLDLSARTDIALVGIGEADPEHSGLCRAGYLEPWAMERLRAQGAVGDIMVEFYDLHGRVLETDISPRVMGMRHEALRDARTVVAVAGGAAKVAAILGALRSGIVDVLVTDDLTARKVLELAAAIPQSGHPHGDDHRPSRSSAAETANDRKAVLDATLHLLGRDGYRRLTIDAIAVRASVERSNIITWWPNTEALVQEACAIALPSSSGGTGSLRSDVEAIVTALIGRPGTHYAGSGPAHRMMMAESQLDADVLGVYRALQQPMRRALIEAIKCAQKNMKVDRGQQPAALADIVLGAIWYRLLLGDAALDAAFVDDIMATVVGPNGA